MASKSDLDVYSSLNRRSTQLEIFFQGVDDVIHVSWMKFIDERVLGVSG